MKVITLIAVLFTMMLVSATAAADEFTEDDAEDMAFEQLDGEEQKAVLATLQKALDDSIEEAEDKIREDGQMLPFGYALNAAGEGQFLRLDHEEGEIPAGQAAQGIQRSIAESAIAGNLVGSLLYVTMASPAEMGEMGEELMAELDEELEDARMLLVEMQHLAGVGALTAVPYWQSEDEGAWVFGEPQQTQVEPRLRQLVQDYYRQRREAAEAGAAEADSE